MKARFALALLAACGGRASSGPADTVADAASADAAPSAAADAASADATVDAGGLVADAPRRDDICVSLASEWRRYLTDIFVLLDSSASMNCPLADGACDDAREVPAMPPSRWTAAVDAINALATSPYRKGSSMALRLFPDDSLQTFQLCDPAAYSKPRVPMVVLPEQAALIASALSAASPTSTTPLAPALQGAIDYARAHSAARPEHGAVVLLVTDGLPKGCDSTLASTAMVAQAGFEQAPSIKTFVLGIGSPPELDQVALAGTGGAVHQLASSKGLAEQLELFLRSATSSLTCDFLVPPTTDRALDYDSAHVRSTIDGNAPASIGRIENPAACGDAGGWYYDTEPSKMSTQVTLCPQSCDLLQRADVAKVELVIGCL